MANKSEPLTESEATEVITKTVNALLWKRLLVLASVFGIANLAVLYALWKVVLAEAKVQTTKAATEEVQKAVGNITEPARLAAIDNVGKIYTRIGASEERVSQLERTRNSAEEKLQKLVADAEKFRGVFNDLDASKEKRVAEFLALADKLGEEPVIKLQQEIQRIDSELKQKVSLQKEYRIRSDHPDQYDAALLHGPKSVLQTAVTTAKWNNVDIGTHWQFVEKKK